MFYREAGQFKTTYAADQSVLPINLDRWFIAAILFFAFVVVPLVADEYWLQAVLIQFLVFALAAIGLNLLTGYAGQLSLGTGGFMAVGGYMTYKITTTFPDLNILVGFGPAVPVAAGGGSGAAGRCSAGSRSASCRSPPGARSSPACACVPAGWRSRRSSAC